MRPLAGSARALHRIRSGDEVTDSGSSTHSRRGGRRRSGRQECKSNQHGKQYSQNGSPPAGHVQPQPDCDTRQGVTATVHTALRIRGRARAEQDSALEQSVELMAVSAGPSASDEAGAFVGSNYAATALAWNSIFPYHSNG